MLNKIFSFSQHLDKTFINPFHLDYEEMTFTAMFTCTVTTTPVVILSPTHAHPLLQTTRLFQIFSSHYEVLNSV